MHECITSKENLIYVFPNFKLLKKIPASTEQVKLAKKALDLQFLSVWLY